MTATPASTELSDERLLLRPPTLDDVEAITAACQDPEIPRWIAAIPSPYTVDDARWFVTSLVEPGWTMRPLRNRLIRRSPCGASLMPCLSCCDS